MYNPTNKQTNSVARVCERTILTERQPLVGEVSANFWGRGVSRSQRGGYPTAVISVLWTGAATFSFKKLLNCTHEAEWTPFQTNYSSENLVAPEMGPGAFESVARNSDHYTTEAVGTKEGKIPTAPPTGGGQATSSDDKRDCGDLVTAAISGLPVCPRPLFKGRKNRQDRFSSHLGD
jgi:hypothetical protein